MATESSWKLRVLCFLSAVAVGGWLPLREVHVQEPWTVDVLFDVISSIPFLFFFWQNTLPNWREDRQEGFWSSTFVMIVDLIGSAPLFSLAFVVFGTSMPAIMIIKFLALRHLWQMRTLLDFMDTLHPVMYRILPILIFMPMLVHLIACGWIALGSGTAGPDPIFVNEYIKAVYWGFTTLTTVGYGDISAKTPPQMIFACGVEVMGVAVFGFVLSNVASLVSRMDAAREHHMSNLDRVESFMKYHELPSVVRHKVRSYFRFMWKAHQGYEDKSILESLPKQLRADISLYMNRAIIEKVPILNGASSDLLEDLVLQLRPKICLPGETIFKFGDRGDGMYFIQKGTIDILTAGGERITSLADGAFFGEMSLISDKARNATVRAVGFSDLYFLSREAFEVVLGRHQEFRSHMMEIAEKRAS